MFISNQERTSEIQRLRVLADLLELEGMIQEDDLLTKEDIGGKVMEIISKNFLYEPSNIYLKNGAMSTDLQ